VVAPMVALTMPRTYRDELLFDLCMALRRVPPGVWRDMGKRRLPADELAERVVAEAILEHLIRCRWEITRPASAGVSPTRQG
jgi:hypothetical protein